jgi:hypothetical protein
MYMHAIRSRIEMDGTDKDNHSPTHNQPRLGDRSYEKRKNAALDLEQHIKLLAEAEDRVCVPYLHCTVCVDTIV